MCGRYTLTSSGEELATYFEAEVAEDLVLLSPRFNIAPTQDAPVIRVAEVPEDGAGPGERVIALHRWGLIPAWAKDAAIGNRMINARSETASDKPAFREAIRTRRCLVPLDGFYEWKRRGKVREPSWFHPPEGEGPWAAAGLWERWWDAENRLLHSFTILTTDANEVVSQLHDRMPMLLDDEGQTRWMDAAVEDPEALTDLRIPWDAKRTAVQAVSLRVNDARAQGPELLNPPEPPDQGELFK
ncbi:MAG: SOS response-associated peptidase [Myxococcota bacterium]|nr:SOS response-associated peptidase [Myxococcota bacterium]